MSETDVIRQKIEKESATVPIADIRKETVPFGESISLDELARQQGVSPAHDLDKIASLWPVDDDPDELLNFILTERAARRKLRRDKGAIS